MKQSLEKESDQEEVNNTSFGDTGAEPVMIRLFINTGKKDIFKRYKTNKKEV